MKYFLIAGNTRVGSTWLQACLNSLPGVFSTREIRWKMPFFEQEPLVHNYVTSSTESMKERLDYGRLRSSRKEINATGAKLKLDPNGYIPPSYFSKLEDIIEKDISIIMLRRPYYDIFATWKAHGIRHLANPLSIKNILNEQGTSKNTPKIEVPNRFKKIHGVPLSKQKVLLTQNGKIVNKATALIHKYFENGLNEQQILHCSVETAIQEIFVLFYNDLMLLPMIENLPKTEILDYSDIEKNFYRLAKGFSNTVSKKECELVLSNSPTLKIENDEEQLVFPNDALIEISSYLFQLFQKVQQKEIDIKEILCFDTRTMSISFSTPELHYILSQHKETQKLLLGRNRFARLLPFKNKSDFWRASQKTYVPVF